MRIKKLKFKKEIVANLSDAESKQIKGGTSVVSDPTLCGTSCIFCNDASQDVGTSCCGDTYANCTEVCC